MIPRLSWGPQSRTLLIAPRPTCFSSCNTCMQTRSCGGKQSPQVQLPRIKCKWHNSSQNPRALIKGFPVWARENIFSGSAAGSACMMRMYLRCGGLCHQALSPHRAKQQHRFVAYQVLLASTQRCSQQPAELPAGKRQGGHTHSPKPAINLPGLSGYTADALKVLRSTVNFFFPPFPCAGLPS